MRHVVAVTHPSDRDAFERAKALADGLQIGQELTRVVTVGEAVDDRHARGCTHRVEPLLGEGAEDGGVDVAAEHMGGVLDRFAPRHLRVLREDGERLRSQLVDADLEGQARARRGLLEDDGDGLADEGSLVRAPGRLERVGAVQDRHELVAADVVE